MYLKMSGRFFYSTMMTKSLKRKGERFLSTVENLNSRARRTKRMNKRLDRQIGQKVAEKRGLHWALTSLAEASWGIEESPN